MFLDQKPTTPTYQTYHTSFKYNKEEDRVPHLGQALHIMLGQSGHFSEELEGLLSGSLAGLLA